MNLIRKSSQIFIFCFFVVLVSNACQVENVASCQLAQDALSQLEKDCLGKSRSDLACSRYSDYPGDCTEYFLQLKENLRCKDGEVIIDNTGKCIE